MRQALLSALVVFCILLQIGFLPALRPFGVVPDIMLPLVVLIGLYGQASVALIVGVAGGLCFDISSHLDFGLWTGLFVLAAIGCGYVHRAGVELRTMVAAAFVAMGTFVSCAVVWFSFLGASGPWSAVIASFLIQLVLNLILTILLAPVTKALVTGASSEVVIG